MRSSPGRLVRLLCVAALSVSLVGCADDPGGASSPPVAFEEGPPPATPGAPAPDGGTAAPDAAAPAGDAAAAAGETVVATGAFANVEHRGSGTVQLVRRADGVTVLRFGADFRVESGPTLHVYLTNHASPSSRSDVERGFVDLGRLTKTEGAHGYKVDAPVEAGAHPGVIVYCAEYHVVFVAATLR